jgi:WD40 repeat protein
VSLRRSAEPTDVVARWALPGRIVQIASGPCKDWVAVVTGDESDAITLLDLPGGQPIMLTPAKSSVRACHPAPNGRLLAAARDDGTVAVWDVGTRRAITGIRVASTLHDLTWTSDSRSLCLAGSSGGYLFDLRRPSDLAG